MDSYMLHIQEKILSVLSKKTMDLSFFFDLFLNKQKEKEKKNIFFL